MYSSDKLFQHSWDGYFGDYFQSCETTREINTKITLEWAQKQFVTRAYIILFLTQHNESINDNKNDNPPRASLARFTFYWWRRNRLLMTSQWPDNCDAIKWIVISNSLDIDFIHGDIHGRSCKKYRIIYVLAWWTVYALTWVLFWCLFTELRSNEVNKHQNNTRVSV